MRGIVSGEGKGNDEADNKTHAAVENRERILGEIIHRINEISHGIRLFEPESNA